MESDDDVLRGLPEVVPDARIDVNPLGGIEHVDARAERLFGWSADDLVGRAIDVLVAGRLTDPGPRPAGVDLLLSARRHDGSHFPAEIRLGGVPGEHSAHLVAMAVRDCTERLEPPVGGTASTLSAGDQPPRGNALQEQAGGIAHDLNNLLGVVLNYSELIDRVVDDRAVHADLGRIRAAAERGAELTGQLLELAHPPRHDSEEAAGAPLPHLDEDLLLHAIRRQSMLDAERDTVGVVVIDDHLMFAESLARLLDVESDIQVLGIGADGCEALSLVERLRPRVLLLDFDIPKGNGISVATQVKSRWPTTKIVMISGASDDRLLLRAIEAGCSGFLTKDRAASEVANAVRVVASDEAIVWPARMARLLPRLATSYRGVGSDLTGREREVLGLLAQGAPNKAIAAELYLSVNTIRNYVQSILTKLGAHSKLEAVATAQLEGLLVPTTAP